MRSTFAALALALALGDSSASAGPRKPPYNVLDELRTLCVPTKARPAAVRAAALAAGYSVNDQDKDQVNLEGKIDSVALRMGVGHLPEEPEIGGPIEMDFCQLFVFPATDQSSDVLAWLGVKERKPPVPWTYFVDEGPGGPRIIGGRDMIAKRRAIDAGRLRLIQIQQLSPDGVMVMYGAVRRPPT
jgi:hypothetical protein